MTPNRPEISAKKSGSRKSSAGAMQTRLPQDPRSRLSLLWKHKIWTAAALAAVILVAFGLGYQLLNGSNRNMASAAAATFVGSETCAGCHRAQAQLWHGSQHKLAMQHATTKRYSAISRCDFRLLRRAIPLLPQGRKILRRDRWAGRQARRLRGQVHVRRRAAAAISDRVPDGRLQALSLAWDTRPKDRAASAGFISIRTRRSSTTTCCTGPG